MMDDCGAKIRPFPVQDGDPVELVCGEVGPHAMHGAVLTDYAYPGSHTVVKWMEDDRRTFRGEFTACFAPHCILPIDHPGVHAV